MSLSFSEAKLEQAIIELLQDQGYQHLIGDNVPRSSLDQVIIEDDLRHYLAARYQPDGITEEEIQRLIEEADDENEAVQLQAAEILAIFRECGWIKPRPFG